MTWLRKDSPRFIQDGPYVGADRCFWLKIVKHQHIFRKPTFTIELITHRKEFLCEQEAIYMAKQYICDWHDLIGQEQPKEEEK